MLRTYVNIATQEIGGHRPSPLDTTDHEIPILGDFNTIAGGFTGGGPTKSARKRYTRCVMTTATIISPQLTLVMTFSNEDLADVIPHEDDPVVLSVIMVGRNVHRVLIDQGGSANVMFWDPFVGMRILRDQLQSFDEVLVGFSSDPVEVRGYVDLRTTFTDDQAAKTIVIRYIVVNAPSSYNLLLRRPSLNKLGVVVSMVHIKMKFPAENGDVITTKVDQEVARKCYENNLRTCKRTYNIARTAQTHLPDVGDQGAELDPRSSDDHRGPKPVG